MLQNITREEQALFDPKKTNDNEMMDDGNVAHQALF